MFGNGNGNETVGKSYYKIAGFAEIIRFDWLLLDFSVNVREKYELNFEVEFKLSKPLPFFLTTLYLMREALSDTYNLWEAIPTTYI